MWRCELKFTPLNKLSGKHGGVWSKHYRFGSRSENQLSDSADEFRIRRNACRIFLLVTIHLCLCAGSFYVVYSIRIKKRLMKCRNQDISSGILLLLVVIREPASSLDVNNCWWVNCTWSVGSYWVRTSLCLISILSGTNTNC